MEVVEDLLLEDGMVHDGCFEAHDAFRQQWQLPVSVIAIDGVAIALVGTASACRSSACEIFSLSPLAWSPPPSR